MAFSARSISRPAIQLNDVKMTDPSAVLELAPGNVLRLSKKHAVRFK